MKFLKGLILCIAVLTAVASTIAYAETNSVHCGGNIFTYDDNGNVTISGGYVSKEYVDDFLSYAGKTYSVTKVKLINTYDIEQEAFAGCQSTLKEINIPITINHIGHNAFGETHNVQIKYDVGEEYWSRIDKENDDEYYGNIEFYSNGYASIGGMWAEAYQDKVLGRLFFDFAEKDCVAEFKIYTLSDDGEKVLSNTYTLDIPAGTDHIDYEFDFVSDGKTHLINVVLCDSLTNRTQWGNVFEREFFAYDNPCICSSLYVNSYNSELTLYMDFLYVENDCVAFVEIFDYNEDESLSLNKNFVIELPANTQSIEYDIPLALDNKNHELKVSFYDNMTSKNELFDSMTYDFEAMREYEDFLYDYIDDETVKITGYQYGWGYDMSLPVKILEYTAVEIAENAFEGHSEIESIIIPNNYIKIGNGAFSGCTNLEKVKYTGTQDEWANVVIEENNESLTNARIIYNYLPEMHAFWDYSYDGEDFSVSLWIDNCYKDCTAKIELVNLSKNETTVLYYDIESGTTEDRSIAIPLSNYDETFRVYGSIISEDKETVFTLPICFAFFTPYPNEEISEENDFGYFVNENNEAEIVGYKGSAASLTIPDTLGGYPVVRLRSFSFSGLEITDLTIGKGLKEIGYGALSYCFKLKNITVNPENEHFKFEDGVLYNADKTELILYLLTNTETHFEMPNSVVVVHAHAFEAVENLKSITISENVKRIERQAFAYSLISGELILPEGLEAIGSEALSCQFTKIHIPKSVVLIAKDAMLGSNGLTEITVEAENEKYTAVDGILYNKDKTVLIKYPEKKSEQSFKIPDTVTDINEAAFMGTENLIKVVIPQSVKLIYEGAFSESSLQEVFYLGTEDEWADVLVGDFNEILYYDVKFGGCIAITSQLGNEISFEVKNISVPARVMIAYYKNGVFEKVDERPYVAGKTEAFTLDSTFDYEKDTVKIMVWDTLSGLKPLCESVKIGK